MVMERIDLELERQKRGVEVAAVEGKLRWEIEATMEKYKVSTGFAMDVARTLEGFWASKEFTDTCVAFSHEAFVEGHKLGMVECRSQVIKHHWELDLSLNEGNSDKEPSEGNATVDAPTEVTIALALKATSGELITFNLMLLS